jgi:putative tricarboxylic transport membrane protein
VFKIPFNVLFPCILFFCCIGTFSINNSLDDVYITAAFGLMGSLFMGMGLDAAPLMLGFILGPMLEEYFRRQLLISRGDFTSFFTRPISGSLLALIAVFLVWHMVAFVLKQRRIQKSQISPVGCAAFCLTASAAEQQSSATD